MTALATKRVNKPYPLKLVELTLPSGIGKAYHGGRACLRSDGKVVPASSAAGLLAIGKFITNPADAVDATSADKTVTVDLETEKQCEWWTNDSGGGAVAATDVGKVCYMLDDQTVTMTSTGRSPSGRVWGVDSTKGVLVEKLEPIVSVLDQPTLGAYVSNDSAPTTIVHNAVYAVPATGAASTITLPAAAPDGTRAYFAANGTANGHTVQYRDATGTVAITTALTASKRHLVTVVKVGGAWTANAYVSP